MPSLVDKRMDYFPTESEISDLFKNMGWPSIPANKFVKDYAALKIGASDVAVAIDGLDARVTIAEAEIVALDVRVTAAEAEIVAIDIRLTTAEGEIEVLRIDLDAHVAAESAHGATGDIVGTDDYAQPALGGTVFLGAAVADASLSSVTPPAAVAAAGATYVQAYAQAQTDAINALSTALAQAVTDLNAATTQLNALLASERAAKQIAP